MNRVDKLILSLASMATLVAFLSQCPAASERALCARFAVLPETLVGSAVVLLITTLAACSFAAMLVSTALHHRTHGHNSDGRTQALAVELVWVAIPIVIIVAVAIPASGLLAL